MARPMSSVSVDVLDVLARASGPLTAQQIAGHIWRGLHIARAELVLVRNALDYLQRQGQVVSHGTVRGSTRPARCYCTTSYIRRIAEQHGTQIPAPRGAARQQQRDAVDQLLLAWGA